MEEIKIWLGKEKAARKFRSRIAQVNLFSFDLSFLLNKVAFWAVLLAYFISLFWVYAICRVLVKDKWFWFPPKGFSGCGRFFNSFPLGAFPSWAFRVYVLMCAVERPFYKMLRPVLYVVSSLVHKRRGASTLFYADPYGSFRDEEEMAKHCQEQKRRLDL